LAQSVTLNYLENDICDSISDTRELAEELTEKGYLRISYYDLKKKIAIIYLKKNKVNLETDILDTPDYFWENDKFQPNFHSVIFNIKSRKGL